MKLPPWIVSAVLAAAAAAGEAERKQGIGPEMLPEGALAPSSDLPSDEELAALRIAGGAPDPKPMPRRHRGYGLREFSLFLGHGGTCTLLPKGSMIHCPDALAPRILAKPAGKLMPWSAFLLANRNWIGTREVSPAQVKGEAPIPEGERAAFAAGGKIVIATLRGHPVTVLARSAQAPAEP